jgi:nucleoid-associated protein YgaU
MASLTAHLVETGDHGRLGFHPSCPVCRRERLFGALSSEPVVSRRAQAVFAGGVLAFSTAAPGAVLAKEPDRQREGLAAPDQPTGDAVDDPGFDPGGETALPFETAPAPVPQEGGDDDDADGAPLEAEPVDDPDAQLVPLAEPNAPMAGDDAPVPPAEAVVPGLPTASPKPGVGVPVPAPPADSPPSLPERPEPAPESGRAPRTASPDRAPTRYEAKVESDRPGPGERAGGGSEPSSGSAVPVSPAVAVPADEPVIVAQTSTAETGTSERILADARFHVVAPGDSLWAIAKRLLGREASAAQIAREVTRLWSLNEDRIGTGDPDMLMVGTKLTLR